MSRRARTGTGKPGWRSGLLVFLAVMSALSLTAASAMADIGDGSTLDPVSIEASNTPSSATESGATIVSDKADYSPGETVVLTGEGWQPGEAVQIVVKDDGLQTEAWQHDATVTADEHGTISDQFELPTWVVATYTVTATGEVSGTAFTTFTDAYVNRGCGAAPSNPIVVTLLTDEYSATNNSVCSLREAINASNELATVDAITLGSGTYLLSLTSGSNDESRDDLDVMADLTITGAGSGSTAVDAQSIGRVFHQQNAGTDFVLKDLTVQHGAEGAAGGGIRVDNGTVPNPVTLKLDGVVVTNNTITGGNGGGGIFLNNVNQTATVENSTVTSNNGNCNGCDGGGIANIGATLNLKNSHVNGNTTHDNGGGIFESQAGDTVLDNSTVDGNHSVNDASILNADGTGGGVHMLDPNSTLELKNGSSISNNDAPQDGGGLYVQNGQVTIGGGSVVNGNDTGRDGGGIQANTPVQFSFTNSTLAGNDAGRDGGGFYGVLGNNNNELSITKSTISGNTAVADGGGVWLDMVGTLANDTITNNTAGGTGGGLLGRNRAIGLYNVTLSHNAATGLGDGIRSGRTGPGDVATISLSNTIVAVNDGAGTNCSSTGTLATTIVNVTNNLDSGSTCGSERPTTASRTPTRISVRFRTTAARPSRARSAPAAPPSTRPATPCAPPPRSTTSTSAARSGPRTTTTSPALSVTSGPSRAWRRPRRRSRWTRTSATTMRAR